MNLPLFLNLGSGEIFLIVMIMLMFFGSSSIPTMARALGKGMREFRDAAAGLQREIQNSVDEVRESIDLKKEIEEVNDAARNLTKHVQEGLDNIEKNTDPEKIAREGETKTSTADPANPEPLTSADPVSSTETTDPVQTAEPTVSKTETPASSDEPIGPPNTIKRG